MIWQSDSARNAGFTLMEMIVVIAILGLLLTLAGIRGTPVSPATHARAAARELSGALRAARGEAIATNRSVTFMLDVTNRTYLWGKHATQALPGDLRLALLTSSDQVAASNIGKIRFDPDGGSSGGRVSVAGGGRAWLVGVDWLSGRVTLEEQPH